MSASGRGAQPSMAMGHALAALREAHVSLRLAICVALGVAIYLVLPEALTQAERGAIAWIAAALVYLAFVVYLFGHASPDRLRRRARAHDSSHTAIFVLIVVAAAFSLSVVVGLLGKHADEAMAHLAMRVALAGGVVVSSWTLIHTVFAIHYTHIYYGDGPAPGPDDAAGLLFPGGNPLPDFWDFAYFSLVLGMTCQVSDVQITSRQFRRLAALHGALSFFFNTVILALTVNFLVNAV